MLLSNIASGSLSCLEKKRGLGKAGIHHASCRDEQTVLARKKITTYLSILLSKGIIHIHPLISVSLQTYKDKRLSSPELLEAIPYSKKKVTVGV